MYIAPLYMSSTPLTNPLPEFDLDHLTSGGSYGIRYGHVYRFTEIAEAHAAMESSQAAGKLVVLT
jgi:hypothetical protein